MTVFEAVKQISCNDAAARLGIEGKRTGAGQGRWRCPFHDDRHPSMACYDSTNRFYCFTCHASGDAANLYAKVRGLSPVEAAKAALTEFGMEIPGGCDRPRREAVTVRRDVVSRAVRAIREEFRRGMGLFLQGQVDGMVSVMEKAPDPEGWKWNHALQRACKMQEEVTRWDAMSDEDVQEEICESLLNDRLPQWGEETPTPGRALFREIMDELECRDEKFPRLNLPEQVAALDELCRLTKEVAKGA